MLASPWFLVDLRHLLAALGHLHHVLGEMVVEELFSLALLLDGAPVLENEGGAIHPSFHRTAMLEQGLILEIVEELHLKLVNGALILNVLPLRGVAQEEGRRLESGVTFIEVLALVLVVDILQGLNVFQLSHLRYVEWLRTLLVAFVDEEHDEEDQEPNGAALVEFGHA